MSKPSDIQCPFCGSDNIQAIQVPDNPELWHAVCCSCLEEWVE